MKKILLTCILALVAAHSHAAYYWAETSYSECLRALPGDEHDFYRVVFYGCMEEGSSKYYYKNENDFHLANVSLCINAQKGPDRIMCDTPYSWEIACPHYCEARTQSPDFLTCRYVDDVVGIDIYKPENWCSETIGKPDWSSCNCANRNVWCGDAHKGVYESFPTENLCVGGQAINTAWSTRKQQWTWDCEYTQEGSDPEVTMCHALRKIKLPINRDTKSMHSILVSISNYPGTDADIPGNLDETSIWTTVLAAFDFRENGNTIRKLVQSSATKNSILQAFDIAGSSPIFAYLSGHSSPVGDFVAHDYFDEKEHLAEYGSILYHTSGDKLISPSDIAPRIGNKEESWIMMDTAFSDQVQGELEPTHYISTSIPETQSSNMAHHHVKALQYNKSMLTNLLLHLAMASGTEMSIKSIVEKVDLLIHDLEGINQQRALAEKNIYEAALGTYEEVKTNSYTGFEISDKSKLAGYYLITNGIDVRPLDRELVDWGIAYITQYASRLVPNLAQKISIFWELP